MGAQTDRIAQSWERRFGDEAVRQFENDKRHLLALLREAQHKSLAQKATVNWLTLDQEWQVYLELAGDNWREAFIPLMKGVVTDQGNALNLAFGMQFDVRNLFAEAWFNDYTIEFAQPILATTERDVRQLLQQAQAEGWSIPTMQKHLTEVFEQYMAGELTPEDFAWFEARMPAYRRELIARSETIRSSNRGSEALYRDWGVQYKEWLTALDDRTCPWCAEMNGKRIPTDGRFFDKGDVFAVGQGDAAQKLALNYEHVTSPPLHPACRCTLIPWNPAWDTDATAPVAEGAGAQAAIPERRVIPTFGTTDEAIKWGVENGVAREIVLTRGVNVDGLREMYGAILEVRDRFGGGPLAYMGDPKKAPGSVRGVGGSNVVAAYSRGIDSLLFRNLATDADKLHERIVEWNNRANSMNPLVGLVNAARKVPGYDEVIPIVDSMTERRWLIAEDTRDITYHEMGHRINYSGGMPTGMWEEINKGGYRMVLSEYGRTQQDEYFAEAFTSYMKGDVSRLYPKFTQWLQESEGK